MKRRLVAGACVMSAMIVWTPPIRAQRLEACSRGGLAACFELLNRPRLDPGRRAAIEFHVSEMQAMAEACRRGGTADCEMLAARYPDLPADILAPRSETPRR